MPKHATFQDFIQVAGIRNAAEADMVMECGVRYLGFPLRLPVNEEDLSESDAAAIIHAIRPPCCGVPITYQSVADEIAEFMAYLGARIVQLHGEISTEELTRLRCQCPDLRIIKSLIIGKQNHRDLVATVRNLAPRVDAFITDTFDAATGASGATGKTHDWGLSRDLVRVSPKPVILAGGLTADNVRQAILAVNPAGVDAHTGLEDASGGKDKGKVLAFVAEARAGFRQVRCGPAASGSP